MTLYTIKCDYACECGMAHTGIWRFSSHHRLAQWLIEENTNIEVIHSITEDTPDELYNRYLKEFPLNDPRD